MRRLFEECKIGNGNAQLLSESLAFAKPEDLKEKEIIREFYARCRASQELIYSQLGWASANAEKSRIANGRGSPQQQKRSRSEIDHHSPRTVQRTNSVTELAPFTREEELLAALLASNEQLTEALRLYDDLERVGIEREAEERSRKETRIDRNRLYYDQDGQMHLEPPQPLYGGGSSHTPSPATSPSPSPVPSVTLSNTNVIYAHQLPAKPSHIPAHINATPYSHHPHISSPSLAPPPPAPHGPRLPTANSVTRSRTPSPDRSSTTHSNYHYDRYQDVALHNAAARLRIHDDSSSLRDESEEEYQEPTGPSAKALGKRRQVNMDESEAFDPDDLFYEQTNESQRSNDLSDDDSEDMQRPWQHHAVQYVYDAAAERMQERLREGGLSSSTPIPGVVH